MELFGPFNPTLHGGGHYDPPQQLCSLTAPTGRFGLDQSSWEFGHMGTNCDQDPKKVSKFEWCLSYTSCDEMIKKGPCNVGLMEMEHMTNLSEFSEKPLSAK